MEYLSDIELYFSRTIILEQNYFILDGDEFKHCVKVMRNKTGNKIYSTDGSGNLYEALIEEISNDSLKAKILNVKSYKDCNDNITFCIPNLRNPERLKFALEKCTELGVTKFIVFNSQRSINKNINIERLDKIILAALKQSLRTHLPKILSLKNLQSLDIKNQVVILFDQGSNKYLKDIAIDKEKNYIFIFGPEGGFTQEEIKMLNPFLTLKLSENRLRSETAIIKAASILL